MQNATANNRACLSVLRKLVVGAQSFFTSRFVFGAPSGVDQRDSRGSLRSLGLGLVGHVVGTKASVKFYRCQFRMRRSTQRELGFHPHTRRD
jgi:hypothetical protein